MITGRRTRSNPGVRLTSCRSALPSPSATRLREGFGEVSPKLARKLSERRRTAGKLRAANKQLGPDRAECWHNIGAARRLQRLVDGYLDGAVNESPDTSRASGRARASIHRGDPSARCGPYS